MMILTSGIWTFTCKENHMQAVLTLLATFCKPPLYRYGTKLLHNCSVTLAEECICLALHQSAKQINCVAFCV